MALKGTLKDFGIADIFQLIGQQTKTGVLHLKSREEEVHIAFSSGNIVRADSASRRQRDLLGSMLLNAELIVQSELDEALDVQKRTLQRLGDVLIEKRYVQQQQLKEMFQLQVTETIYRLFTWKSGTYEFEQGAVEFDSEMVTPIRSENVLMEGFRRVDEWPSIRRVIGSAALTFQQVKPLPSGGDEGGKGSLTRDERRVYGLARPGVSAEKIGDLSRLGEFESHKVLLSLINAGYLRVQGEADKDSASSALSARAVAGTARLWAARLAVTLLVLGAMGVTAYLLDAQRIASGDEAPLADAAAQHLLVAPQTQRLADALAVFRLEKGAYPNTLDELAKEKLVTSSDLRYPFAGPYYYRKTAEGSYVLLPPIQ